MANSSDVQILITAQDRATDALKKLTSELAQVSSKINGVQTESEKASSALEKMASGFSFLNGTFGSFVKNAVYFSAMGAAINGVSTAFTEGISAMIGYNAKMQDTQIAFNTMIGNADAAKEYIKEMKDFAAVTPFEFKDVEVATNKLLAFGWRVKDVIPDLTTIGNAASALNVGTEGINRIILALGQLSMKSHANAQDLRQLQEVGIDSMGYLAKKFNLTAAAFDDLSKTGISGYQAMRAVLEGMAADPKFADMMEKKSKTITGEWSTLKDNMTEIAGKIGESTSNALAQAMDSVTTKTQTFVKTMRDGGIWEAVAATFSPENAERIYTIEQAVERAGSSFTKFADITWSTFGGTLVGAFDAATAVVSGFSIVTDATMTFLEGHLATIEPLAYGAAAALTVMYAPVILEGLTATAGAIWAVGAALTAFVEGGMTLAAAESLAAVAGTVGLVGSALAFLLNPLTLAAVAVGILGAATYSSMDTAKKSTENGQVAVQAYGQTATVAFNQTADAATSSAGKIESTMNRIVRIAQNTRRTLAETLELARFNEQYSDAGKIGGDYEDMISRKMGDSSKDRAKKIADAWLERAGGRTYDIPAGPEKPEKHHAKSVFDTEYDKMQELQASLEEKVAEAVDTKPAIQLAKLNKQIVKYQNDIDDATKAGVDTSAVQAELDKYKKVLPEKIQRELLQTQREFEAETNVMVAKSSGDRIKIAEAEAAQKRTILEKQVRDWHDQGMDEVIIKPGMTDEEIEQQRAAARIKIKEREAAANAQIDKDEADATRAANIEKDNWELQYNSERLKMGQISREQLNTLNKQKLDDEIKYLEDSLTNVKQYSQEYYDLHKQLAEKIEERNTILSQHINTAAALAVQDVKNTMVNYTQIMTDSFNDMNSTVEDNFTKMLSGQENFAEGMKNIWKNLTTDILALMAKLIYYQAVYKPMQTFFTNLLSGWFGGGGGSTDVIPLPPVPQKAVGGLGRGWTIVGENGPELVNFSNYGRVYTADQTAKMMGGSQTPVTVNVINQSGQQVQVAKQETSFNGVETVVNLWLEGYAQNYNGMRTILGGAT